MKYIKSTLLASVLAVSGLAQEFFTSAALSTTPATVLTNSNGGAFVVTSLLITATNTTTPTTVSFYDSSGSTNIINAAYTRQISYATNVTSIFTNENSIIITNTYPGTWTGPVTVAAATNERPYLYKVIIPADSQVSKNVLWLPGRGVTAVSSSGATLQLYYNKQ